MFNTIVIGDMVFQLINPFIKEESQKNKPCARLESIDKIYHLFILVQPVAYDSSNQTIVSECFEI